MLDRCRRADGRGGQPSESGRGGKGPLGLSLRQCVGVAVVTSDWHIPRARLAFDNVFKESKISLAYSAAVSSSALGWVPCYMFLFCLVGCEAIEGTFRERSGYIQGTFREH
jgi:hypothetical protein